MTRSSCTSTSIPTDPRARPFRLRDDLQPAHCVRRNRCLARRQSVFRTRTATPRHLHVSTTGRRTDRLQSRLSRPPKSDGSVPSDSAPDRLPTRVPHWRNPEQHIPRGCVVPAPQKRAFTARPPTHRPCRMPWEPSRVCNRAARVASSVKHRSHMHSSHATAESASLSQRLRDNESTADFEGPRLSSNASALPTPTHRLASASQRHDGFWTSLPNQGRGDRDNRDSDPRARFPRRIRAGQPWRQFCATSAAVCLETRGPSQSGKAAKGGGSPLPALST